MKRIITALTIIAAFFFYNLSYAQGPGMQKPVKWAGAVQQEGNNSYNLIFRANIQEGWHIFSQHTPKGGPIPLKIDYLDDGNGYKTNGETKESATKKEFDDVFNIDIIIWENKATLTQNIAVNDANTRYVKAELSYQVCEDMCINEEYYFVFDLKNKTAKVLTNYDQFESYGNVAPSEELKPNGDQLKQKDISAISPQL